MCKFKRGGRLAPLMVSGMYSSWQGVAPPFVLTLLPSPSPSPTHSVPINVFLCKQRHCTLLSGSKTPVSCVEVKGICGEFRTPPHHTTPPPPPLSDPDADLIVKAQVHAGGRGKGTFTNGYKGGVKVLSS
jgi:hypothetical protein